jgi:hypothetical protein
MSKKKNENENLAETVRELEKRLAKAMMGQKLTSLWAQAQTLEGYALNVDAYTPFINTLEEQFEFSHKDGVIKNKMRFTDKEVLANLKRDEGSDFLFTDKSTVGVAGDDTPEITAEQMVAMTGPELFALAAKEK